MKYLCFSISDQSEEGLAEFAKYVRFEQEAGQIENNVITARGSWGGETEASFIMNSLDFLRAVEGTKYVVGQECIMEISECNKRYADIVHLDEEGMRLEISRFSVGCLKSVSREEAEANGDYTYRPDMDTYWIAQHGNPDHVPNPVHTDGAYQPSAR